jgi:hypothetical protein
MEEEDKELSEAPASPDPKEMDEEDFKRQRIERQSQLFNK